MNSQIAQHKPYPKTKLRLDFVIFVPILAKNWLPWQRRLDPCNRKSFLWIGRPRKRSVIVSNHILAISRRNAFIAILIPKLVAMLLSLVYRSVTDEFLIAQTLSQNQTLYEYDAYN